MMDDSFALQTKLFRMMNECFPLGNEGELRKENLFILANPDAPIVLLSRARGPRATVPVLFMAATHDEDVPALMLELSNASGGHLNLWHAPAIPGIGTLAFSPHLFHCGTSATEFRVAAMRAADWASAQWDMIASLQHCRVTIIHRGQTYEPDAKSAGSG